MMKNTTIAIAALALSASAATFNSNDVLKPPQDDDQWVQCKVGDIDCDPVCERPDLHWNEPIRVCCYMPRDSIADCASGDCDFEPWTQRLILGELVESETFRIEMMNREKLHLMIQDTYLERDSWFLDFV